MPSQPLEATATPSLWIDINLFKNSDDQEFDRIYPETVRRLSIIHWSPVKVCRMAAKWLVEGPATRVLDIGCGPGKFCMIGATTTQGHFTGVEQRKRLVRAARNMLKRHGVSNAEIVHGNITGVDFRSFDAFYLFNPFEENIVPMLRIDHGVELAPELYSEYTRHVLRELARMPVATRVVTYCGDCAEIPECYLREATAFGGRLILWVKHSPESLRSAGPESRPIRSADFPTLVAGLPELPTIAESPPGTTGQ
jgi:SAM-dependent methyltransferase